MSGENHSYLLTQPPSPGQEAVKTGHPFSQHGPQDYGNKNQCKREQHKREHTIAIPIADRQENCLAGIYHQRGMNCIDHKGKSRKPDKPFPVHAPAHQGIASIPGGYESTKNNQLVHQHQHRFRPIEMGAESKQGFRHRKEQEDTKPYQGVQPFFGFIDIKAGLLHPDTQ